VNWLTADSGRVSTVAKGARRPKSPFVGKLDIFYAADFSFTRSRTSELHNLREVKLHETHGAIREDILKLQQAAYAVAFVELATETETPLPEIYELVRNFLKFLCGHNAQPQNIFTLELKFLRELGLAPDFAETRLTPGAKKIVQVLLENDWNNLSRLKLTEPQIKELNQWLHGFLIFHLGKLPRGRNAAGI
jgi:DNA repair protein RecO (recombination protein O)